MAIEYPPNAGTHQAALALFQHLGRNITLPQIIQSRVNPYRFIIENGHDALYRSIRDDVDISKDYVDIDAGSPLRNLQTPTLQKLPWTQIASGPIVGLQTISSKGSHGSLFISGDNAYQISNQRKDARSLHPDNNFAVSPKVSMTWSTGRVKKSFSIVLDAIVEITIGAQRAALRKHRDERRQHS